MKGIDVAESGKKDEDNSEPHELRPMCAHSVKYCSEVADIYEDHLLRGFEKKSDREIKCSEKFADRIGALKFVESQSGRAGQRFCKFHDSFVYFVCV